MINGSSNILIAMMIVDVLCDDIHFGHLIRQSRFAYFFKSMYVCMCLYVYMCERINYP